MNSKLQDKHQLTAGQVARALGVDLKTVHHWVARGHLKGTRTSGGHLRFCRMEVIRRLVTAGKAVPAPLLKNRFRVAVVGLAAIAATQFDVEVFTEFFDGLLALGNGNFDMVVVALDSLEPELVTDLAASLRRREDIVGIGVVGVTRDALRAERFLAAGADLVVESEAAVAPAVTGLLNGTQRPDPTSVPAVRARSGFFRMRAASQDPLAMTG
jgi:excisionase family DNA binding protein